MNTKQVILRCDDYAEACVFNKYYYDNLDVSYEMTFEDSYVGGDYTGFSVDLNVLGKLLQVLLYIILEFIQTIKIKWKNF